LKYIIPALLLSAFIGLPALADDNIANCEIVVQQRLAPDSEANVTEQTEKPAQIATFMPAGDFIFSVFGSKPHMSEVDGKPIRAVMCMRGSVVPSEFDLKIIRTGIPLYLSQDFDAKDSALMGISKTAKGYAYEYTGPDLSADDLELLKLRMKALNNAKD